MNKPIHISLALLTVLSASIHLHVRADEDDTAGYDDHEIHDELSLEDENSTGESEEFKDEMNNKTYSKYASTNQNNPKSNFYPSNPKELS